MAKRGAYQSGIGTTGQRSSPLAPFNTAPGMPQGIFRGAAPVERGQLVGKGGAKGGEPAAGVRAARTQTYERHGPRFRTQVKMGGYQNAVQSGATQANGRIIPSYAKMQDRWSGGNFWDASRGGM